MRGMRALGFAAIYLFIHIISIVVFTVKPHLGSPELAWYLQHPWHALSTMFGELIRSPLLILSLLSLVLYSFILGFITDWFLSALERRIQLRKRNQN